MTTARGRFEAEKGEEGLEAAAAASSPFFAFPFPFSFSAATPTPTSTPTPITDPVCRSPCSSASLVPEKRSFSLCAHAAPSASLLRNSAASSSCGEVCLLVLAAW